MLCPRCEEHELEQQKHLRWHCPCGFACSSAFFFDDENLAEKRDVGLHASSPPSKRAKEILKSKIFLLDDLSLDMSIAKLQSVIEEEADEQEYQDLIGLMREILGRNPETEWLCRR